LLLSARAHELPDTVLSRCHVVTFTALAESFVVDALTQEGVEPTSARRARGAGEPTGARLAARVTGGNMGRARPLANDPQGLAFRDAAQEAVRLAAEGPPGARPPTAG